METCKSHEALVVQLEHIKEGQDKQGVKIDKILEHVQAADEVSRAHRKDDAEMMSASCAEHRAIIVNRLEPLQKSHDFIATLFYVLLSVLGVVATVSRLGWL